MFSQVLTGTAYFLFFEDLCDGIANVVGGALEGKATYFFDGPDVDGWLKEPVPCPQGALKYQGCCGVEGGIEEDVFDGFDCSFHQLIDVADVGVFQSRDGPAGEGGVGGHEGVEEVRHGWGLFRGKGSALEPTVAVWLKLGRVVRFSVLQGKDASD